MSLGRRSVVCHFAFMIGLVLLSAAEVAEIWSQFRPPVRLSAIYLKFHDPREDGTVRPADQADLIKWGWWYRLCAGEAVETITDNQGNPWKDHEPRIHPIKTPTKIGEIVTGPRPQPWVVPPDLPDGKWMLNLEPRMWCWVGERLFPIQTPRVQAPFTVRRETLSK